MKLSTFLASTTWASVIALVWMILLRAIPADAISFSSLVFFFVVAVLSSIVQTEVNQKRISYKNE